MADRCTMETTSPGPRHGTLLAAFLYFALTLVLAYPLWVHPASRVFWMGADTELFAWTLAWDTHALTHNPFSIFDANIFYPERLTLAYSENLIGSALLVAPVLWISNNPILAVNAVSLLSCFLCGLGTYVLARRLGLAFAGSLLAGIIFAFSPPRFGRLAQLHLTAVQWIPFCLAFLHSYFDSGRRRDLLIAVAFFTLEALSSGHGAVFLILMGGVLVLYRLALGEPVALLRRLRDLGVTGILLLVPVVLMVLPYRTIQREMGFSRTLEPAWWTDWASPAASFIASPTSLHAFLLSRLGIQRVNEIALGFLFPGILPLALAAVAVFSWRSRSKKVAAVAVVPREVQRAARVRLGAAALGMAGATALVLAACVATGERITIETGGGVFRVHSPWRPALLGGACLAVAAWLLSRAPIRWRALLAGLAQRGRRLAAWWREWGAAHRRDPVLAYGLVTAGGVWLSLGAPLGIWPLIYRLPGFSLIRVPQRFSMISLLGLAILAAAGFDRLAARLGTRRRAVAVALAVVVLAAEFAMPIRTVAYSIDIPPIDRWLDTRPKPFVVAEVPFNMNEHFQTAYMLHSTAHWQKTIHGYSGFRPGRHDQAYPIIRTFPDRRSLDTLASLGVTYVVVHTDAYPAGTWPSIEARIAAAGPWLRLERVDGAGRVYSLHPQRTELGTKNGDVTTGN